MKTDGADFQTFFEAAPGHYLILSPDLKIVAATDVFCRNTMTERAQILGRSIFDVFPDNPDDSDATSVASLRSSLMRVLETKQPDSMGHIKYDIRKPDAEGGGFEERYWNPVNMPIFDANGEIRWILNQAEEVTDLVRARRERSAQDRRVKDMDVQISLLNTANRELARQIAENARLQEDQQKIASALIHSEERFRSLAANLPGVVYRRVMHCDGTIRDDYVSPGVRDLLGVDPEEFVGGKATLIDFAHPDDRERKLNALKEHGAKLEPLVIEVRKISRDNKIHWWQIHTTPSRLENGDIQWDGIALDITDRKTTERQLQQAVKMEAVGQLTGGVAHDFNNLLTVILANAEILAEELANNPPLRALAELAQKAAERGAELTKGLLAFARRQALEPQAVDVNKLITHMDDLLRRSLGEEIEIETVTAAGLWRAQIDPTQLESAILNLAINARDAMPGGGKLTIETVNARVDSTYSSAHDEVSPGQYVMVSVSDTGEGMDKDVINRVFEPFFTTKEVGKGTGLGLSMVFGFVKQSGGHIKIYSELGKGTTVKLYLPRSYEAHMAGDSAVSIKQEEPHGRETILLVEDDELVRTHVEGLLSHLGYAVMTAHNGAAALAMLERGLKIDLLFTDMVMPGGMSGRQLTDKVAVLRPGLKVLYTSGYTENAIVHHGHLDPGVHLIRKPYRRQELALKLRAVLDEK